LLTRDAELLEEVAVPMTKRVPSGASMLLPFVVRPIAPGRGSGPLSCPDCRSPLNLIQPDETEPTRLLGICDTCSKWAYLVELEPDWKQALLIELPGSPELQRAHADAGAKPRSKGTSRGEVEPDR
jgi:hypothetical protein